MRRHRTTATALLSLLAGVAAAAVFVPATVARSEHGAGKVPRLVFPLVAKTVLWDNYGDPRGNGRHAGIDMENPWRAPVVAVEPGRVSYASSSLGGCMLYLYGRSGTMYLYIHLNNDTGPRNDNAAGCVQGRTYAVPNGASVLTGQQIAFNGDSGDASGNPHLHFEVHPSGGADANPFPHLKRATKPLFAGREGERFSLGLRGSVLGSEAGALELQATKVRVYPGGRWLEIDPRVVELAVPPASAVEEQLATVVGAQTFRTANAQTRVAVYTAKAKVTQESIAGAPGALTASRVSPLR